jgi:Na+-transporting methylmalonyl-CoA/oxaloacetate decarboxylase gamma subunit
LSQAIEIFISGITGVFFGMTLLYISIKIMALVSNRWITEEKEKKDA